MAFIPNGILGPFSKRLGPLVGCICNTRANYVRTRPLMYHDAKTMEQMVNRAKLKGVMAYLSVVKGFVNHTFGVVKKQLNPCNVATRLNFHQMEVEVRHRDGGEAVVEAIPKYEQWRLSEGKMMPLDGALLLKVGNELELRWVQMYEGECSWASDKVCLLVYNETRHKAVTWLNVAKRGDGFCRVVLPEKWGEEKLHIYVAVSDEKERMFGNSQYFGITGSGGEERVEAGLCGGRKWKNDPDWCNGVEINRFAGKRLSDTKYNGLLALEQSAHKALHGKGSKGIWKGFEKGEIGSEWVREEPPKGDERGVFEGERREGPPLRE